MFRLSFVLLALFALNVNASAVMEKNPNNEDLVLNLEKQKLEKELFGSIAYNAIVSIESISVIALEEEVSLGFNTQLYLPENFVAVKGMFKLDWNTIELYEIEEEVDLGLNTKDYLPINFVPSKGLHKIDWNTIELIEVEEDIDLGFNPKEFLPINFNPNKK